MRPSHQGAGCAGPVRCHAVMGARGLACHWPSAGGQAAEGLALLPGVLEMCILLARRHQAGRDDGGNGREHGPGSWVAVGCPPIIS